MPNGRDVQPEREQVQNRRPGPTYSTDRLALALDEMPWRVGRKVGRTIYAQVGQEPSDDDPLIGVMDAVVLAEEAVIAHNVGLDMEAQR